MTSPLAVKENIQGYRISQQHLLKSKATDFFRPNGFTPYQNKVRTEGRGPTYDGEYECAVSWGYHEWLKGYAVKRSVTTKDYGQTYGQTDD